MPRVPVVLPPSRIVVPGRDREARIAQMPAGVCGGAVRPTLAAAWRLR